MQQKVLSNKETIIITTRHHPNAKSNSTTSSKRVKSIKISILLQATTLTLPTTKINQQPLNISLHLSPHPQFML
jgi:hypothetical protein